MLNFRRSGADLQMKFERTDGALIDRLHIDSCVLVVIVWLKKVMSHWVSLSHS